MIDFEIRKVEILKECEEVLTDIEILKKRVLELMEVLANSDCYEDVYKYYPNDVDLEEGLTHIELC